ncbi:MAG: glycosyltransferase family 2 protein [Deltaproteobacteria bacterium]|nr:glycosyltransferase family 2 protein [Deltaproteobacteria bacterium]
MRLVADFPFITVVMPVRNEEQFVASTLDRILKQDYPADRFEVIVADGMSDDKTREIVSGYCNRHFQIRLIDNPKRLSSTGRNVGFKKGKGDVFLVIDGHCYIPTDRLFRNIASCLEKSGAQCLGRAQPLDPPEINEFQKAVALARGSRIGHGGDSFIYSEYEGFVSPVSHGAIYRKEVFDRVGYVDESFDACEDVEFNYRVEKAGLMTYMSPGLTIKYYPRETLKALFLQTKRYGYGRFNFLKKHHEAFTFNMIIPFVFFLGLILLPVLGLIHPHFWWAFGTLYGLYVLIILFISIFISAKNGFRYLRYLPPIFFLIHFGFGWGFITGLARKTRQA